MKLYRVIVPVADIERGSAFYVALLAMPGKRISSGRHYFNCGGTILACFDPKADGDDFDARPNPDHIYISVDHLEEAFGRAKDAGCSWLEDSIKRRPWGELSFYGKDPFGNKFCFVDETTVFTGD